MISWCMDDGYPSAEMLQAVKEWDYSDCAGLFDKLQSVWIYPTYFKREGWTLNVSTAGWSGHEDLIHALQENRMIWSICWVSSRRGGHYAFEIPAYQRQASAPSPTVKGEQE